MKTTFTPGPWRIQDSKTCADVVIVPHFQKKLTAQGLYGDYYPLASVSKSFVRASNGEGKTVFEHLMLPDGQAVANARLIAAAPCLLSALAELKEWAVSEYQQRQMPNGCLLETLLADAQNAIDKAKVTP